MINVEQSRPRDPIMHLKGKSVSDLKAEGIEVGKKARAKLQGLEDSLVQIGNTDGFIYNLGTRHLAGQTLRSLGAETGLNRKTLTRLFTQASIPVTSSTDATKARWQDEGFKKKISEGNRAVLANTKAQNADFQKNQAEAARTTLERLRGTEEFKKSQAEAASATWKALWQEDDFRRKMTDTARATLVRLRQDPEFNRKSADATSARLLASWEDENFRGKMSEVARTARLRPEHMHRYHLLTIQGERRDVGYSQSAWESNVARVLQLTGREYLAHESLRLSDGSLFNLDFLTVDGRNRLVGYEIMAHPLENPVGWAKLEKAIDEYPNIMFTIIDEKYYNKLRKAFSRRIRNDPRFCGWEDRGDNLKTNPEKYGPVVVS